ncbi:MAG TPA: Pr6Pr family membrane protein [Candidatus Saccharimonadales bacterium]
MSKKQFIIAYRLGFALLVAVAIAGQLAHSLENTQGFSIVNFFSFFTIQSNLFGAVTFLMSAYVLYKGRKDPQLESLRGAATLYMVITGVVYSLLLTGVEVDNSVAWSNAVIHYIFPVVILLDWLYIPSVRKFRAKQSLLWLIYPIIYGAYSLFRGPLAHHWYPYPFINASQHGYDRVALNCVIIAAGAAVLALVIGRLPEFSKRFAKVPVAAAKHRSRKN